MCSYQGLCIVARNPNSRLEALDAIAELSWDGYLFETANPFGHGTNEHHVRSKLLEAAFIDLVNQHGAKSIVLETRDGSGFNAHDRTDHDALRRLQRRHRVPSRLRIEHRSKQEPLLAIPDLLAGARTDHLCAVNHEAYAHHPPSGPCRPH